MKHSQHCLSRHDKHAEGSQRCAQLIMMRTATDNAAIAIGGTSINDRGPLVMMHGSNENRLIKPIWTEAIYWYHRFQDGHQGNLTEEELIDWMAWIALTENRVIYEKYCGLIDRQKPAPHSDDASIAANRWMAWIAIAENQVIYDKCCELIDRQKPARHAADPSMAVNRDASTGPPNTHHSTTPALCSSPTATSHTPCSRRSRLETSPP